MPPSWAAVVSDGGLGCAEVGNRQLRFLTAEDVNVPTGRTRLATPGTISALADHKDARHVFAAGWQTGRDRGRVTGRPLRTGRLSLSGDGRRKRRADRRHGPRGR